MKARFLRILVRWTPSDIPLVPNESYAGHNWYEFDPTKDAYVWHCHGPSTMKTMR